MNNAPVSNDTTPEDIVKQMDHARTRQDHLRTTGIYPRTTFETNTESGLTTIIRRYRTPHYNVGMAARLRTSHQRRKEELDILATINHHDVVGNAEPSDYKGETFNSAAYLRAKQTRLSNHIQDKHLRFNQDLDLQSKLTMNTLKRYQNSIGRLAMTDTELQSSGYETRLEQDRDTKTCIAYTKTFSDDEQTNKAINYLHRLDIMHP